MAQTKKKKIGVMGKREGNWACLTNDNFNISSPRAHMHLYSAVHQLARIADQTNAKIAPDLSLQGS